MRFFVHGINLCLPEALKVHRIVCSRGPVFQIHDPTIFTLKGDTHVGAVYPLIHPLLPCWLVVPRISVLIVNDRHWEQPPAQGHVVLCMPEAPTRGQSVLGAAEVCAEDALPRFHGKAALHASPAQSHQQQSSFETPGPVMSGGQYNTDPKRFIHVSRPERSAG